MLIFFKGSGVYLQWADCAGHETTIKDTVGDITPSRAKSYLNLFNMTANAFQKNSKVCILPL